MGGKDGGGHAEVVTATTVRAAVKMVAATLGVSSGDGDGLGQRWRRPWAATMTFQKTMATALAGTSTSFASDNPYGCGDDAKDNSDILGSDVDVLGRQSPRGNVGGLLMAGSKNLSRF